MEIKSSECLLNTDAIERSEKIKDHNEGVSKINVPEYSSEEERDEIVEKKKTKKNVESPFNVQEILPPIIHQKQLSPEMDTKDDSRNASYWNGAYALLLLGAVILNTAVLTLIPRQNSIQHPEYWYQSMIMYIVGVNFRWSGFTIIELSLFTDTKFLLSVKSFVKFFFAGIHWRLQFHIVFAI